MASHVLNRRQALRSISAGTLVLGAAGVSIGSRAIGPRAPAGTATIVLDEPIGTIKPGFHGQFVEHLGGVVYDGVWVGPDSKIPNIDGLRRDLIEAMIPLGPVTVRWPGGCFADRYHWRDGIGPRDKRPRRFGRWREDTESNQFGTHEFLRFCELTKSHPYLAANVGTGSAEEFQQWVEYCNAPAGSLSTADERVANGHEAPFRVRTWGVGNESWGCGGKFTPEDYCREYRRFTEWVPGYHVPLYFVASGPNGNDVDWTRRFFAKWADGARAPMHGWSPHYYCGTTGHALKFSVDQWYEMLFKANKMENLIRDQWTALAEHDPKHAIKLVIDEWGTWHPEGTGIHPRHLFEQMGTLRDALVAGLTLDTFNRHAEKIDITCIAQLVNCLQSLFLADGDKFVRTPTYHVFALHTAHQNQKAVRIDVQAPQVAFQAMGQTENMFRVAGSASVGDDHRLVVTLVHTHASEPFDLAIELKGGSARSIDWTVLNHSDLNAHNTFESPNSVVPAKAKTDATGSSLQVTLPPASVNRLEIRLA
jgi:alpha-N-arabinofuranosidase